MQEIGTSSLFVEKYRPKHIKDLILPDNIKNFLQKMVDDGEPLNLLLFSTAGKGKTSTAFAICNDLDCDKLYINASIENSIDVVRSKVQQFAMTSSFRDGKKIVILDEMDRMQSAQEALKALIEQTEANCRFIITTNNLGKIIDPIKSRCQLLDYNFTAADSKSMLITYFKRMCWVLDQEKIEYDKKILAEFIQKMFPDLRKTLNELQKAVKMFGKIDEQVLKISDDAIVTDLIKEMKAKKILNVQKIAANLDPSSFYKEFYSQLNDLLVPQCIPDVIMTLGEYSYKNDNCTDKELQLICCLIQLIKECNWK